MLISPVHGGFLEIKGGALVPSSRKFQIGRIDVGVYSILYDKKSGSAFSTHSGGPVRYGHLTRINPVDNGYVSVFLLDCGAFLCCIPKKNGIGGSSLETRDDLKLWERFSIIPDHDEMILSLTGSASLPDAKVILDFLQKNEIRDPEWKVLIEASFFDRSKHSSTSLVNVRNQEDAGQKFFDRFLSTDDGRRRVHQLLAWCVNGRPEKATYDIRDTESNIGRTSASSYRLSPDERLLHHLRSSIDPVKTSCLIATARNEGVYLLDWVAHHIALGFEKIYIYSNNNTDGSDKLLAALSAESIITWINNSIPVGGDVQAKSYSHALHGLEETLNYEWAAIIDLDELITINQTKFKNINEFLTWHSLSREDVIAMNWCFVGSSGQKQFDSAPTYQRFSSADDINVHIKSIIRPKEFFGAHPHYPIGDKSYNSIMVEADGQPHTSLLGPVRGERAFSDVTTASSALVFHYFFKSAEEFIWKFSRNRGNHPLVYEPDYINMDGLEQFIRAFETQFSAPGRRTAKPEMGVNVAASNAVRANLLRSPEIREANEAVCREFSRQLPMAVDLYLARSRGRSGHDFLRELLTLDRRPDELPAA